MIIKDLFSHKIHSSGEDWPLKLIEIASVFADFDGLPYDRQAIEESFMRISPRASIVARDPSKYRDEISAYPAYLGLYRLELQDGEWILRLSETAKRFLVVEEPNVAAFMLLQLTMFQYPNGNGVAYNSHGRFRLQGNAADRSLGFINQGIHLSPFRFICKSLLADSIINGVDSWHPRISINELSILCNDPLLIKRASPDIDDVVTRLKYIREKNIQPFPIEKRLHILNHTDFIEVTNGWIHLRTAYSPEDAARLSKLLHIFSNIDIHFNEFDNISTKEELEKTIIHGNWARYFDGVAHLSSDLVQEMAGEGYENDLSLMPLEKEQEDELIENNNAVVFKYPLRERGSYEEDSLPSEYIVRRQADPEATRIKRQKSNLRHKILLSQLDEHLRKLGAKLLDNEHIDLYAEIPNDGSFLFEVKSVSSENLLSQTRKGLSQLYEYRFRYSKDIREDVVLCLIYPKEPNEIEWLQEYLCKDRNIAVAWFEGERLCYPSNCAAKLSILQFN